jgi:hypothetical protein
MRHLEDEDIARLIDGTISKKEREDFLKHLSECETCLSVYSETLKFMEKEKEKKRKTIWKLFPETKKIADRFGKAIATMFPKKRLIPALAVLIIILLMVPFVLNELHQRRIKKAQVEFIAKNIEEMETYAFSPSKDIIYAAVRAGIFVEDLSLLVNTGEKELKTKIATMLSGELKIFISETSALLKHVENIDRKNYETIVRNIRALVEKQSLSELFRFGCFVEHSILSTYENKTPNQEDINKYQRIAQKYKDKLPIGVFKELKKLKPNLKKEKSKNICVAIKQIFLE